MLDSRNKLPFLGTQNARYSISLPGTATHGFTALWPSIDTCKMVALERYMVGCLSLQTENRHEEATFGHTWHATSTNALRAEPPTVSTRV